MKRTLLAICAVCCFFPASAVASQYELTQGQPTSEQPAPSVTRDDLRILKRADEILSDETKWNRKDNRICKPEDNAWSLFCALQKASLEVLGKYEHRRVALEEVRLAVERITKGKDFEHRLMDYNNLSSTRFRDIKKVLKMATEKVAAKLRQKQE